MFSVAVFVPTHVAHAGGGLGTIFAVVVTIVAVVVTIYCPPAGLAITLAEATVAGTALTSYIAVGGSWVLASTVAGALAVSGFASSVLIACAEGLICGGGSSGGVPVGIVTGAVGSCNYGQEMKFYIPEHNIKWGLVDTGYPPYGIYADGWSSPTGTVLTCGPVAGLDESTRQIEIYRFTIPASSSDTDLNSWFVTQIKDKVGNGFTIQQDNVYHTSAADSTGDLIYTAPASAMCQGNVCTFIDQSVPNESYVAYVAKIVGEYTGPGVPQLDNSGESYTNLLATYTVPDGNGESVNKLAFACNPSQPNKFLNTDNAATTVFPGSVIGNAIIGPMKTDTAICETPTPPTDPTPPPAPTYSCTGLPSGAGVNYFAAPDYTDLTVNTSYTYSDIGDTATKCQFNCASGYEWNGSSCVAIVVPTTAPACGSNATTYATETAWPSTSAFCSSGVLQEAGGGSCNGDECYDWGGNLVSCYEIDNSTECYDGGGDWSTTNLSAASPTFPAAGASASWSCGNGNSYGTLTPCSASRVAPSVCAEPLTQNVTVACDPNTAGVAAISGSVTRSQTKGAYPACTFGTPVTVSNSTYVSGTCAYPPSVDGVCSLAHYYCVPGTTTSTSNVSNATTWTWSCPGANGGSATACSEAKPKPTISLTATPNPVAYYGRATLTWSSTNAATCTATGAWDNQGTLSGSGLTNSLTVGTAYGFSCTNPSGTTAMQIAVGVNAAPSCPASYVDQTITGANSGTVWGSGPYTNDSVIAKAAVHAGLLTIGQSGKIRLTPAGYLASYTGSTRNGVTTTAYASPWCGVTLSKITPAEKGVCGATHYNCTSSVASTNKAGDDATATPWTWDCLGVDGTEQLASNAACSEAKPATAGSVTGSSCTIGTGKSGCEMHVIWSSSYPAGVVTIQRPYSNNSVFATAVSGDTPATFPSGTFALDLYDGITKLASGNFTASCAAGDTWDVDLGKCRNIGICGTASGSTPQDPQPTGAPACAEGTLDADSPADTATTWKWSCGSANTCAAPKYGCSVTTDTNYNSDNTANDWGCALTCANAANNYPTCNTCADPLFWNGTRCVACTGGCTSGACNNSAINPAACSIYTPTATLSVSPSEIDRGQSATLTWSSTHATTCVSAGGFDTKDATAGSASTGALTQTANYQITCEGPGGSVTSSAVEVTVYQPELKINAVPKRVKAGLTAKVTWSGEQVKSCTVSGTNGFSQAGLTGTDVDSGVINNQTTFTLRCQTKGSPSTEMTASTVVNINPAFQEF